MQINNDIYQTYGHDWWAEDAAFDIYSLRYCMNPVRYGYFKRKLQELRLPGKTVLDVGCGGGFLAEEFARDGFAVTGIDPADRSLEAARKHSTDNNLEIDYRAGKGEALPFSDSSFDAHRQLYSASASYFSMFSSAQVMTMRHSVPCL